MRRFENLTYLFVGVALGFMLFATTNKGKVKVIKKFGVVYLPKTTDITDNAVDSERRYYEHLYNSK